MSSNIVNKVSYLRTSREFPKEPENLAQELTKAYVEISNSVNSRVMGIFPTNKPAITGENWFLTSEKRQGLRQVYSFQSTSNIPHNIDLMTITAFTRAYGSYTDGADWYGLPFLTSTAIAGQISFYITSSDIVFVSGAGAPTLTSGNLVLEWIANV